MDSTGSCSDAESQDSIATGTGSEDSDDDDEDGGTYLDLLIKSHFSDGCNSFDMVCVSFQGSNFSALGRPNVISPEIGVNLLRKLLTRWGGGLKSLGALPPGPPSRDPNWGLWQTLYLTLKVPILWKGRPYLVHFCHSKTIPFLVQNFLVQNLTLCSRVGSEKMKPFCDVILHFCFQPVTPPVSKVQE